METHDASDAFRRWVKRMTGALISTRAEASDPLMARVMTSSKNGRVKQSFGSRTFYKGRVQISPAGPGGVPPAVNREILVQRKATADAASDKGDRFCAVMQDGGLDTRTEFLKAPVLKTRLGKPVRPDISLTVVGGGEPLAGTIDGALDPDTLDRLARTTEPGFVALGSRECCVASIVLEGKARKTTTPAVIERVPTANGAEYCLLNADMSTGEVMQLVNGAVSDPIAAEAIRRVRRDWTDAEEQRVAQVAVINALTACTSLKDAMALVTDLLPPDGGVAPGATDGTYAAAATAAGAVLGAKMPLDAALEAARGVVDAGRAWTEPGMQRDLEEQDDLREMAWPLPDHVSSIVLARTAYATAKRDLAAGVAAVDRRTPAARGADMTALGAVQRTLFAEKRSAVSALEAAASLAVREHRAAAHKAAVEKNKELDRKQWALGEIEERVGRLRQHRDELAPRAGAAPTAAFQAAEAELERVEWDRTTLSDECEVLRGQLVTARADLGALRADRSGQHRAAARALSEAWKAAPGRQQAAVAAATAASSAMDANADEERARYAAQAAHLASLAGADQDAAASAAQMMERHYDGVAVADRDRAGLLLALSAIVQAVTDGVAPDAAEAPAQSILAASAAARVLNRPEMPNAAVAATMRGSIGAAEAAPVRDEAAKPTFIPVSSAASPAAAAAPLIPALPAGYEAVKTAYEAKGEGDLVDHLKHVPMRKHPITYMDGKPGGTRYVIKMEEGDKSYWTDFTGWSGNANQVWGEIAVRPTDTNDSRVAAQGRIVVAFNGATGKWGSLEQRDKDLKKRTEEAYNEVMRIVTSRNSEFKVFRRFAFAGEESVFLDNLCGTHKGELQEHVRLFVQGVDSLPTFNKHVNKVYDQVIHDVEQAQNRKKAIKRGEVTIWFSSIVSGAALGVGGARIGM